MKTALNLLTFLIMGTFLFFLTTLTFQKPKQNHPPPKSTRIITPSTKARNNPFPTLQKNSQTLTDQQLRTAIKTEWAKLNNRPNNRQLPTLVSHLRELGRREGLDGVKFLETLPSPDSQSDEYQARIAIIAGWGIDHYKEAGAYLYRGQYETLNFPSNGKSSDLMPLLLQGEALDDIGYEIHNRWIKNDRESFLAMLVKADEGLPTLPARRSKIYAQFPSLQNSKSRTLIEDLLIVPDLDDSNRSLNNQDRQNLGGVRADSLVEWATRNPRIAFEFLRSDKESPNAFIDTNERDTIAYALSHRISDYTSLIALTPEEDRHQLLQSLVSSIYSSPSHYQWPVDARPDPIKLTNQERASALKAFLINDRSFPKATRENHLKEVQSFLQK